MIDLLLLGTGAMQPLPDRWLSSLLVRVDGELVLFDCGEGTQIPWKTFGWGFRRLGAICLSHWHADHIAGLPGLLHAVANAGRTETVHLVGPVGIARIVAGLRVIAPHLPYELAVRELADGEAFPLPGGLAGRAIIGLHRDVPCLGYRVDLARARPFDPGAAVALGVPQPLWGRLQRGEPVTWSGGRATPEDVLGAPRRGLAFGYLTDTRPLPTMAPFFADVDLLVCEGTYAEDAAKATRHGHMSFAEAAAIARGAGAGALWLTHFGAAVSDPAADLHHATAVFPRTVPGYSGLTASLVFGERGQAGTTSAASVPGSA